MCKYRIEIKLTNDIQFYHAIHDQISCCDVSSVKFRNSIDKLLIVPYALVHVSITSFDQLGDGVIMQTKMNYHTG